MASALSDRLSRLVKTMRGQARITESNVQEMLREVRMALLEADVALPVVRDFIARVKEKALGTEVAGSLNPGAGPWWAWCTRNSPPRWVKVWPTSTWRPSHQPSS
jgi:signal recognition particle GTPase